MMLCWAEPKEVEVKWGKAGQVQSLFSCIE